MRKAMVAIMVLAIVSASVIVVGAQEESSWVCWRETIAVDAVGNVQVEASYGPFSMSEYNNLCALYKPNPEVAIRFLRSRGAIYEFENVETPVFDDAARSINYKYDNLGWAEIKEEYMGDIWEIELFADAVQAAQYQNFLVFAWPKSGTLTISTIILPESATDISFDLDEHVITYVLPSVTGIGKPRINSKIKYKEKVMSAMYKVYGIHDLQFWLAKTVVKNTGTVPIHDLKVSYKITEYVPDWTTPETYAKVVPGQTIVDLFYPCLPPEVTELTTKRPLELSVRIQYTANNKTYEEIVPKRFELLGINSFVWSNLGPEELTGSWYDYFDNCWGLPVFVTPYEVTVNRFAKEATSGIGASLSDEGAERAMEACYNAICARGIGYITEPSGFWAGGTVSQYIQYPKDTLDRNAGTCIDLAILYCAMCEAVGLKSHMMLIPGHAFPVIYSPSGMYYYPIEMTEVPNTDFANAFETGLKECDDAYKGNYYELDLELLWDAGVTPPW
jgi:hypothetical protein